jgi:hypothetical protein
MRAEAFIAIINMGSDEAPRPLIVVRKLLIEVGKRSGRILRYFPATAAGAQECGVWLQAEGYCDAGWCYSSTIDFPTDVGAPDLVFRKLIEGAAGVGETE